MKITFLGSGGAFTDYRVNYHTNALVETSEGPVLIDCGGTAVQSMKELGVKVWDLVGVFITHMHGDHIGGLEQLLWERFYMGPDGMPGWTSTPLYATPIIHKALRRSLHDCVDDYFDISGENRQGGYYVLVDTEKVKPQSPPIEIGDTLFQFIKTPHVEGPSISKPAFGILIGQMEGECSSWVYWTGDTMFRPDIATIVPQAQVIFHDCSFGPRYEGTVHTHYEDLLTLPTDVRARIVLMHHTQVPDGIDVEADGFMAAAERHQVFNVKP